MAGRVVVRWSYGRINQIAAIKGRIRYALARSVTMNTMKKRVLLIAAGVALAGGVAATPAFAGLAGNQSFSHSIPVPVPSSAKPPTFADDHGHDGSAAVPAAPRSTHVEPGDDRGGATPDAEPTDDHHRGASSGGSGRHDG
jgi:hypothetical protein